jgi:prepilin peptidase dependent protein C
MSAQKGFSLVEILVSLILVSTVALVLIEQQSNTKQLLYQIISYVQKTQYSDSLDEHLLVSLHESQSDPKYSEGHLK